MDGRGALKVPGQSWIEVDQKVHVFKVEDKSHSRSEETYAELERLTGEMKGAGYVPDTRFVSHDMDELQKERSLLS